MYAIQNKLVYFGKHMQTYGLIIDDCGPGNHHIVQSNYLICGKVSGFHIRDNMQKNSRYISQKNFCACLEKFRQNLT